MELTLSWLHLKKKWARVQHDCRSMSRIFHKRVLTLHHLNEMNVWNYEIEGESNELLSNNFKEMIFKEIFIQ